MSPVPPRPILLAHLRQRLNRGLMLRAWKTAHRAPTPGLHRMLQLVSAPTPGPASDCSSFINEGRNAQLDEGRERLRGGGGECMALGRGGWDPPFALLEARN